MGDIKGRIGRLIRKRETNGGREVKDRENCRHGEKDKRQKNEKEEERLAV